MKKNILAALTLGYILSSFISQPANAMYLGGNSDIDTTDISDNVLYSSSNETTPNYDLTNSSLTLKITPIDTDHNIKALSSYSLFLNDNNTHIGDIHTMLRKDLESMPSTMIYPPEQEVLAVYNKLAYIIKPNRNNELISFDDIKLQVSMDQILEQLNLHEFDPTDSRIVNNTLDITLPISINF